MTLSWRPKPTICNETSGADGDHHTLNIAQRAEQGSGVGVRRSNSISPAQHGGGWWVVRIIQAAALREYGWRRTLEEILLQEEEHKRDLMSALDMSSRYLFAPHNASSRWSRPQLQR